MSIPQTSGTVPSATATAAVATTPTGKKRGRQPIKTAADAKASIMREMFAIEVARIDDAIARQTKKRAKFHQQAAECNAALAKLDAIRAEFLKEGIA
jgi:hypothetical protein